MSPVVNFDSRLKLAHYIAMLAVEPFTVNGKQFVPPRHVYISDKLFRSYTCPPLCGGCCAAFSMDYAPRDFEVFAAVFPQYASRFVLESLDINGATVPFYSNRQSAAPRFAKNLRCEFLDGEGRCRIHTHSPFSCRFELLKLQYAPTRETVWVGKKLYRNGWRYQRVDEGVGALCAMQAEYTEAQYRADMDLFEELVAEAGRWGVATIPIVAMIEERKRAWTGKMASS